MKVFHKYWRATLAAGVFALVTACAATFSNHGYAPSDGDLDALIVGVDTRASVEETIGRPSNTGMLKESGWYYVSSRLRYETYKAPEVIDRQLVAISFNKAGTVTNIERFTLVDGQVVTLTRRVTETNIKGFSFFRQLLTAVGNPTVGDTP